MEKRALEEAQRAVRNLSQHYEACGKEKGKKKDKRTTVEESYYLSGLMGSLA